MDDARTRELEGLLAQATDRIVLRRGQGAAQGIDLGTYGHLLRRCRRFHDPDSRQLIASHSLVIEEATTNDRLLEFIRCELSDRVQDDKVHSGTIVVEGGSFDGTPIDELLENLLIRSIADGSAAAAQAFAECVSASSFSYYHFVLLTSLTLDSPVDVFDRVRLIPLPEHRSALPPLMPTVIRYGGYDEMVLSKSVLCIEKTVTPVFHRPTGVAPWDHFSTTLASNELPDLDLRAFCQALSLASHCSVRPTMQWDALLDYEVFDFRVDRGVGTTGWGSFSPHVHLLRSPSTSRGTLTEGGLSPVRDLYHRIVRLDQKTSDHLQVPIERWMRSMEQRATVDRMIDLGIALESLYLPDIRDELRFRFALRAAWHLGHDRSDRERLSHTFKKIYDLRSKAVHDGKLAGTVIVREQPTSTAEFVREGQDLCREAICGLIRTGEQPNWDDLVLG